MPIKFDAANYYRVIKENPIKELPVKLREMHKILQVEKKENKIAKNFVIHDYTNEGNPASDLYNMREPIAAFAREHNIRIDVFDSRADILTDKVHSGRKDKNAKYAFNILFTDLDKVQEPIQIINRSPISLNSNPVLNYLIHNVVPQSQLSKIVEVKKSATYPKFSKSKIMINVPGEEDLQIARNTINNMEDNFMRHFFREIENGVKELVAARNNK